MSIIGEIVKFEEKWIMKAYFNLKKVLGSILVFFLFFTCFKIKPFVYADGYEKLEGFVAEKASKKRVLFISSYSPSFVTFFEQIKGIKSQLDENEVTLDIEFMDSKRFYNDEVLESFYKTLKYKMRNLKKYDVIMVADDNALCFAKDYQDELFKSMPIVFLGVNDIEKAKKISQDKYITGIVESTSIRETIEIASILNPQAKRVVAIVDGTNTGKGILEEYKMQMKAFTNLESETINLEEKTFEEMEDKLTRMTKNEIVIMLTAFKDKTNRVREFYEISQSVVKSSPQPVFHLYEDGLGEGFIGGKVISSFEQGKEAAKMVNRIFKGEKIFDIQFMDKSPNKYIFDYKVMKKYDYNIKDLPLETEIRNRDETFISKYFDYIVGVIIVVIIQFSLILFLQVNVVRRKKSEKDLLDSKKQLMIANDELGITNEELIASLDEIKEQDEKIKSLVYVDTITGLNNRLSIFQIIDGLLRDGNDENTTGILFLDIDNFKNINDTYGHDVGDKVLKIIGQKLIEFESEDISIGRFGGDEFLAVIKNQKDDKEIIEFCKNLKRVFSEKVVVDGYVVTTTISIGISIYPINAQSRGDLVKKADLALYKAKDTGKNKYMFYRDDMDGLIQDKMRFQEAVKRAIKEKEFFLNFQPYFDAKTEKIKGFEALVRWISDEYGYVSPFKFITTAEELGLIIDLGEQILESACEFAKHINEDREDKLTISVNISANQLMGKDFYENTMKIVKKVGLSPKLICLEMTETILINSFETGTMILEKLRLHGFGIALDDFGTGYSSLKYFKDLPVTVLKIDKSFVDNIETNLYDQKLISAMVDIAHFKDVEVVCEGVETQKQFEILKNHDCDTIQGYLLSKPLSEEDSIAFLQK